MQVSEAIVDLQVWKTNTIYDKIYNCRVVKPTYEDQEWLLWTNKWIYWTEFFLDKRFWMSEFVIDKTLNYTDDIELYWEKYYLFHSNTQWFVWVKTNTGINNICWPFNYNDINPIRFAVWKWARWQILESNLEIVSWLELDEDATIRNELSIYDGAYIVIEVWTWYNISAWDYVLFKDWILTWWTVEIELYQDWKIYILWTNSRGSLPLNWEHIDIYSETWMIPVIWTVDWVICIHINWQNTCGYSNVLPWDIEDIVQYGNVMFALKNEVVYFSQATFDDNVQFYSALDRKRLPWCYKLISKWKHLIAMWQDNRLIVEANNIDTSLWYTWYPLNYNSDLYSKYSYIFTDSMLYILQKDKQLMEISLNSLNNTAFELWAKSIVTSVRWMFEDVADYWEWKVFCNDSKSNRFINFLYQKDWNTINYEYDKEYNHWLIHTYEWNIVNKKTDQFLCLWHVSNIWWFTDLWKKYKQSINFTLWVKWHSIQIWLIRTIFWLLKEERLELDIDIKIESTHSIKEIKREIRDMTFDTLPADHELSMDAFFSIPWYKNTHNWNIASIQKPVMRAWRYIKFDFNWYNRFIYWYSYLLYKTSNIFLNERNFIS
jgi:hypothetical protein